MSEICGTCYQHRTDAVGTWRCTNSKSEFYNKPTSYKDSCDEWRKRWTDKDRSAKFLPCRCPRCGGRIKAYKYDDDFNLAIIDCIDCAAHPTEYRFDQTRYVLTTIGHYVYRKEKITATTPPLPQDPAELLPGLLTYEKAVKTFETATEGGLT